MIGRELKHHRVLETIGSSGMALSPRGAPSVPGDEGSAGAADSSGPVPPESLGMT